MANALHGRLTYANVMATLALFVALGGGAWAASGGLVSSSGLVQECVKARGGVPRVVRAHARCGHGTIPLFLATPGAAALRGLRGPRGATGPRGHTGHTGPQGPAGPVGPTGAQGVQGAGGYAFSLSANSEHELITTAPFAGSDEMWLVCGFNKCHAEVLVGNARHVVGSDTRGQANGAPGTTTLINSATPLQATLTEIEGKGGEFVSKGDATVSLTDGSAWHVSVELSNDGLGRVFLTGTAVPASATTEHFRCEGCR